MALLKPFRNLLSPRGRVIPTGQLAVDWTHPLAQGLVGCFLPGVIGGVDLAGLSAPLTTSGTAGSFGMGPDGPGWYCSSGGGGLLTGNAAPALYSGWSSLSMYLRGVQSVTNGVLSNICGITYNNTGTSPYLIAGIQSGSGITGGTSSFIFNYGGTQNSIASAFPQLSVGSVLSWGLSETPSANSLITYSNGAQYLNSSALNAPLPTYGTLPQVNINGFYTYSRGAGATVNLFAIWNRALSASEMQWLDAEPYCFLLPAEGEMPTLYAAAASGASTGTVAGIASIAGVGSAIAASAGTVAGTSTLTGTSTALIPSTGTAAGGATVSGVGATSSTGQAAGTAAGLATVSGIGAAIDASAGTAAGASTATATGASTSAVSGIVAGQATVSGAGAAKAAAIGTVAGQATVSGVGGFFAAGQSAGVAGGVATVSGVGAGSLPVKTTAQASPVAALPAVHAPVVGADGNVRPAWLRFFAQLAQGPQEAQSPTVTASPYSFAAPSRGSIVVSGGTVSSITLTRGRVTVNLGAVSGHFPASTGDTFMVTYSAAPSITFLPG